MNKEEQIKILNSVLYRPWIEISDNERETIETLFNNLQYELGQANKKLDELKEVLNLYSNATIENPNNGYILYQKIKSIIGKENDKDVSKRDV